MRLNIYFVRSELHKIIFTFVLAERKVDLHKLIYIY